MIILLIVVHMTQEQTETTQKPYELLSECPLQKETMSDEALRVLEQYCDIAHERMTLERARRRVDILRDFAGHDVPVWILDVAALAGIAERAAEVDSVHRNSRRYMHRYMLARGGEPADDEVVKALAGLSYVEHELGYESRTVRSLAEVSLVRSEDRTAKNATRPRRPVKGVDSAWDEEFDAIQLADPEKLFELTDHKMFVPILVKAAQTLDMLKNRREITKADAKRYARDALEVYAPFCEIIGYDGFAVALNDAAHSLKLESQRNYDENLGSIVRAEYEETFEGDKHLVAITKLLDTGTALFDSTVGSLSGAHEVKIGSFVAQLDGVDIDGRYRVKGFNALLSKLFGKNYESYSDVVDKLPMDMLGLTFITSNAAESARLLGLMLKKINEDERLIPMPTVERREKGHENGHIHVQGTEDYIATICETNDIDRSRISYAELVPEDFEVAKVTFLTKNGRNAVPTEVQIVTRESRDNGRRGLVGHVLFKLFGKLEKDKQGVRQQRERVSAILKAIHAQKKEMKQPIPITTKTVTFIDSFIGQCVRGGV
jgi:hypothetical protein